MDGGGPSWSSIVTDPLRDTDTRSVGAAMRSALASSIIETAPGYKPIVDSYEHGSRHAANDGASKKLEPRLTDSGGLVPRSQAWWDYWLPKVDRLVSGEGPGPPVDSARFGQSEARRGVCKAAFGFEVKPLKHSQIGLKEGICFLEVVRLRGEHRIGKNNPEFGAWSITPRRSRLHFERLGSSRHYSHGTPVRAVCSQQNSLISSCFDAVSTILRKAVEEFYSSSASAGGDANHGL